MKYGLETTKKSSKNSTMFENCCKLENHPSLRAESLRNLPSPLAATLFSSLPTLGPTLPATSLRCDSVFLPPC